MRRDVHVWKKRMCLEYMSGRIKKTNLINIFLSSFFVPFSSHNPLGNGDDEDLTLFYSTRLNWWKQRRDQHELMITTRQQLVMMKPMMTVLVPTNESQVAALKAEEKNWNETSVVAYDTLEKYVKYYRRYVLWYKYKWCGIVSAKDKTSSTGLWVCFEFWYKHKQRNWAE